MRLGVFSAEGIRKIVVDHTTIECSNEESHQSYISPHGGCAACSHRWLNSLPFYRLSRLTHHEDDLLKAEFRIPDDVEWYKKIIKNVWESEGEEWQGYTVEFFGYRLMAAQDPNVYPHWRIQDEQNPTVIIPLVRTRICYEPQTGDTPIFLELRYPGYRATSAIRGMDADIPIGQLELRHLLRARNRMLNLSSPSFPSIKRGGPHNVKVANLPENIKKLLGKRYVQLGDSLTNVKRDAKTFASATQDWQQLVLRKYPILEIYPDLLDQIDPYPVPSDADASDRILAPWEIAIEIAARETIPNYEHSSVSSDSLKRTAILPNKNKVSPAIKR